MEATFFLTYGIPWIWQVKWEVDTDNTNIPALGEHMKSRDGSTTMPRKSAKSAKNAIKADLEDWGKMPLPDEVEDISKASIQRNFANTISISSLQPPGGKLLIKQRSYNSSLQQHFRLTNLCFPPLLQVMMSQKEVFDSARLKPKKLTKMNRRPKPPPRDIFEQRYQDKSIRSKLLSEFYVSDIVAVSTTKSFYGLLSPALGAPMPRSLFSSAGTTSKNASLDEYTVDVRDLTRWSLPKVPSKHIYDLGSFTLAWSHLVKTLEQTITVEDTEQALELFSESDIQPFREKYKFLHIGCVQIALKPLTLKGLNTSLMMSLRDARCLNWANSLMGVMETSLTNGPVYFNIYPDLALSMTDPHLLKALSLNLITHNYEFRSGSETIAIVYRIYYRVLNTLASHVKIASEKGKTTLVESNILSTKTAIPRTLRWDEIEFSSTWQMAEATIPQPLDNREVEQIVQDADGNVEITFAPNLRRKIPLITAGRISTGSIPSETTSQPEMEGLATDSFETSSLYTIGKLLTNLLMIKAEELVK
ncbi:hypothetical protein H6P81_006235 [Aristolochia fimbriata]|uniref:Uncharacterized protein n=1 Tax=Aristolochia fimbriata TaxID=158543 RepID=A0AAV7F0G6_ARIFI|nr:hypothetical protein H6P81_006235 [Aristolochia fimbriata]